MQHGRNVSQRADTAQTLTAEHLGALVQQTGLGGSLGGAAGGHDDDVVGDQLLHDLNVRVVRPHLGVVAADHGHGAAENTGGHALDERLVGVKLGIDVAVGDGVQTGADALAGVTDGGLVLVLGDEDLALVAVLEVLAGGGDDGAGHIAGVLAGELKILAEGDAGDGRSGVELGVEALAQRPDVGEDALHVHDDGFDHAGEQSVLLLQEVAGHLDAMTHGDLVGGAAHTHDVDALGAVGTGQILHLLGLGDGDDHLGHGGIVAVADDVDHVLVQNAQVALGLSGHGGAVEDVGELGAGHGAAPAIGQAHAQSLANQSLGVGGAAHVSHVHAGDDLAVNGAGHDALLGPDLLALLGGAVGPALIAADLAVLVQTQLGDLVSDVVEVTAFGLHAPLVGEVHQLLLVGDVVPAISGGVGHLPHALTAVVGVSGSAAGGHAEVVTAGDGGGVGAADALGGLGGDAAGAHGANAAADALLAETAVRGLIFDAILPGIDANLFRGLVETGGVGFHLFNSRRQEFFTHL